MSSIFELISLLEDTINQSPKPRMGSANKRIIDYDQVLDILGDLKVSIPDEVRQAQAIMTEKNNILEDAKYRSSSMLSDARIQSERMISEKGVIEEIQKRGKEIIVHAEEKADIIVQGARTYTDQILSDVQKYLQEYITTVENNRQELRANHSSEKEMKARSAAEEAIIQQAAQDRVAEMYQEEQQEADESQENIDPIDDPTLISESKQEIFTEQNDAQELDLSELGDEFQANEEELRSGVEIEVGRSLFLQDDGLDINLYGANKKKSKKQENDSKEDEISRPSDIDRFPWSD